MAVAANFSGWVRELTDYEAQADGAGDPRAEDTNVDAGSMARRPTSARSVAGTSRKGGAKPRGAAGPVATSVSDELEQEMKLLNWHKLANEAALKAAIIKTSKIKNEDARFTHVLTSEDSDEKRQRIQQIIEEEQLKPLQVNSEFFREFEAREQKEERKTENDVQRHIQHLKRLKETMNQREDIQRRRQKYKQGMQELGGGLKVQSIPKAMTPGPARRVSSSNQEEEAAASNPGKYRIAHEAMTKEAAGTQNEVIGSLDKLMELEKRIRHLEDAGLGVDGLNGLNGLTGGGDGSGGGDTGGPTSTKNLRFAKRKSSATLCEPSKTVYAVKARGSTRGAGAGVARARGSSQQRLSQATTASASKKRSLISPSQYLASGTFLTSVPEVNTRERQLRRMTERERRVFLKNEKAMSERDHKLKQDVVIQDWMQKKRQAAQQRKSSTAAANATATTAATTTRRTSDNSYSYSSNIGMTATKARGPRPVHPRVQAPLRGAASGKRIANPHLQKIDDIRRGFDKRKEALTRVAPSVSITRHGAAGNKVLLLQTATTDRRRHKKPSGGPLGVSTLPTSTATRLLTGNSVSGSRLGGASSMRSSQPAAQSMAGQVRRAQPVTKLPVVHPPPRAAASLPSGPSSTSSHAARGGFATGVSKGRTSSNGTPMAMGPRAGAGITLPLLQPTSLQRRPLPPTNTSTGLGVGRGGLGPGLGLGLGLGMPSPPPAAARNPAMPQFSRLQKR